MNGPWSLATPAIEFTEVGYCIYAGSDDPASYRNPDRPSYSFDRFGFRVTLYL